METITKLNAARRQMNTGIHLWLAEDDLASVQTLAWAALTILRDLAKAAGKSPTVAVPAQWQLDRQAANFLKHADKDPNAWLLEIDPVIPELIFHEAIRLYRELAGTVTEEMGAARVVIELKYGFDQPYETRADRRREEERDRERRIEGLADGDREEALADLERDRRSAHSALMAIGRSKLTGEPLF